MAVPLGGAGLLYGPSDAAHDARLRISNPNLPGFCGRQSKRNLQRGEQIEWRVSRMNPVSSCRHQTTRIAGASGLVTGNEPIDVGRANVIMGQDQISREIEERRISDGGCS
jgi:hypothetical protein